MEMSERPTQCKFCGCEEVKFEQAVTHGYQVEFLCSTVCLRESDRDYWSQDTIRCAGLVGNLFRRIGRAVERLKDAPRYDTVSAYDGDVLIRRHKSDGEFTESEVLDLVLAILQKDAGSEA
jgi:hypothetical protein